MPSDQPFSATPVVPEMMSWSFRVSVSSSASTPSIGDALSSDTLVCVMLKEGDDGPVCVGDGESVRSMTGACMGSDASDGMQGSDERDGSDGSARNCNVQAVIGSGRDSG